MHPILVFQFAFEANAWGSVIANKLIRKCDVINRGLSGYNTRWAKLLLPRLIPDAAEKPVAITIFFGANDSALKEENPQQHVPLEEYTENLKCMIQYLKSINVPQDRIILITPPPICEPAWEQQCLLKGCKLNRLNNTAGLYAKACVEVASECGTEVVDLWSQMQEGGKDYTVYLSDGLHLSSEGNQFVESSLWPILEKKLSALPFMLPYWNDVDNANPEASLLQASS
ncbi:hypothetical protein XENTR_v10014946 [Xenopus tropicalis]|nr:hypothetical protein XENTR_v10014946 [Xenopus tropicalis]